MRGLERADAEAVAAATRDPDVLRWTAMPANLSTLDAEIWIDDVIDRELRGKLVAFAVGTLALAFCGYVGIKLTDRRRETGEVFYWIVPEVRGLGLGSRAVDLVTEFAFRELELARTEILIDPANLRSRQLARRCGYAYEGTLRAKRAIRGERRDLALYARLSRAGRPGDDREPPA